MKQEPKIHWRPYPKQAEALCRTEFEILFGGSRGPGKTDAGLAWLTYDIHNPLFRALVIRRNADDLKDWTDRATTMYQPLGVRTRGNPREFIFPSGAIIRTGHLKDDNAYTKYQGHEYHRILIEELTHIPSEENYLKLIASCRSTVEGLFAQIFATTNPGGPGHKWVQIRWQIPDRPDAPVVITDKRSGRKRVFINATVDDNPSLMENDPGYVEYLNSLPAGLREQWRLGYWDDFEIKGAYYNKMLQQLKADNKINYVPYDDNLLVDTWWDLGIHDTTAIWFTQRYGKEIRIIDCYENSGEGLGFYFKYLDGLKYDYGTHHFPHDLRVRELTSGISREDRIRKLGLTNYEVMPRVKNEEDKIEATRALLPYCWFDEEKTEEGIYALKNYRKEWDEKHQCFKNKALHDWSSHYASAFGDMAMNMKIDSSKPKKKTKFSKPRSSLINA